MAWKSEDGAFRSEQMGEFEACLAVISGWEGVSSVSSQSSTINGTVVLLRFKPHVSSQQRNNMLSRAADLFRGAEDIHVRQDVEEIAFMAGRGHGKTKLTMDEARRATCLTALEACAAGRTVVYMTANWRARKEVFRLMPIVADRRAAAFSYYSDNRITCHKGPGEIKLVDTLHPHDLDERLRGLPGDTLFLSDPWRDKALKDNLKRGDVVEYMAESVPVLAKVIANNGEYIDVVTDNGLRHTIPNAETMLVNPEQKDAKAFSMSFGVDIAESARKEFRDSLAQAMRVGSEQAKAFWTNRDSPPQALADRVPRPYLSPSFGPPEPKPEPFQARLARIFGLAPDAPEKVLLDTAKKAWDGQVEMVTAAGARARKAEAEVDRLTGDLSSLKDLCGSKDYEIKRLESKMADLLLRDELRKR